MISPCAIPGGDGLCCMVGKGAYTVMTSNGTIARGHKFTRSETTAFAILFDPATVTLCFNIDIRISPCKGSGLKGAVSWELVHQEEDGKMAAVLGSVSKPVSPILTICYWIL